jgi:glycosyltransferase involved in cell wall biosynthesis
VIWSLEKGGAERFLVSLVKHTDPEKINSIVCCLNWKGDWASELEQKGIKVIALNKKGKFDICVIYKIICVIKQHQIDVVNTHLWAADTLGRISAVLARVPVIISTVQNVDIWKKPWHMFIDRLLSYKTTKFIAVSKAVKQFLIETERIPEEKIDVIYNGIEIPRSQVIPSTPLGTPFGRSSQVREEFGIKNDEVVLAVVGRLVEQKGHKYLFEALNQLNGRYNIKLLVVGEGPLLQSLKSSLDFARDRQVADFRLKDKVIFTGQRKDIAEILNASDCVVLPSLYEGLSVSMLEAMAAGKPVIATNVGGTPELISNNQTGLLVKPRDSQALFGAIETLINLPDKGRKMGERARELVVNAFSIETIAKKTTDFYLSLLDKH